MRLFYLNKSIALIGIGTPTITAEGLGDVNTVTFDGKQTNNALISGFKITGATGWYKTGNGIYCENNSALNNNK